MSGALMVVGATSGAGKSTVVAALCRVLRRRGLDVAPFKAQNMSNHAAVTADGGEVGRAQAMQAAAAGVALDRRMNPVLLKPHSRQGSHVVVLGDERHTTDAAAYGFVAAGLRPMVLEALDSLRQDHPWVVAEGAGGAAEINLLDRDMVNLPLARAAGIPAVLVVDIDKGGAFAAAYGTIGVLPPELRSFIGGVVFNRFRGDPSLLEPGIEELQRRTGVPVIGVLPHLGPQSLLGVEDSLDIVPDGTVHIDAGTGGRPRSWTSRPVRVAAVRLPHLANPSDVDPLLVEPDVSFRWVSAPHQLDDVDLVILPGSRATVADLDWFRERGLADAIRTLVTTGSVHVIGLCAGYQMLGRVIEDPVESGRGHVAGLGLLDSTTRFVRPKIVRTSTGRAHGHRVHGYQIRFGRPQPEDDSWLELDGSPEGAISSDGMVRGTSLHGLFDADGFRRSLLEDVAVAGGRQYDPGPLTFGQALHLQHERLADWLEEAVDVDALLGLATSAARPGHGPGWY